MNVETILRTKGHDVVTIGAGATLAQAADLLGRKSIGAVVVIDEAGGVAGILSERDIVRALAALGVQAFESPVAEVMTRKLYTCSLQDTIAQLMALMTKQRIRHLPVLEDGKLCGIVSIGDVVKHRLEEIEFEAEALREYVATAG